MVLAVEKVKARSRNGRSKVAKACVEVLEGRRLLAGYGEVFQVTSGGALPAVAVRPDGGYVVAWLGNYTIQMEQFDASGVVVTPESRVDTAANPHAYGINVAVAGDGRYVVTWQDDNAKHVYARMYDAAGSPLGEPFQVDQDSGTTASVAMTPDGHFAVAYLRNVPGQYYSGFNAYVRRYDPEGNALGDEQQLGSYWTTGIVYAPSIAASPDGRIVVAWTTSESYGYYPVVVARILRPNGQIAGDAFKLSTTQYNPQYRATVAIDSSGNWEAAWSEGYYPSQLYFRQFDPDGNPLSAAVAIGESSTVGPVSIGPEPDGSLLAWWTSYVTGSYVLRAQSLDSSGVARGVPVSVATMPTSYAYPVGYVGTNGGFMAAWQGDYGGGVYGIRYGEGMPPTGISLSDSSVAEAQIGLTVGTLSTDDPDVGGTFTYSLPAGYGDNSYFQIAGNELRTLKALDADSQTSYSIQVQSHDASGWSITQTFTITATNVNEPPTTIYLSGVTVAEGSPAGTAVGSLNSDDPDAGDTITFSLVDGAGATDNGMFRIDGSKLYTNAVLDYEMKNRCSVRIRATDQGGLLTDRALTISVSNVNEAPTGVSLSRNTVAEGSAVGTVVGTLTSLDPDLNDSHTYTLVAGDGDTDNASFTISPSGSQLVAAAVLGRSGTPLSVRVRTRDAAGLTAEQVLQVIVTNVPPSATFHNDGTVVDGSDGVVRFSNVVSSPGATLTYSYDFDNDGVFEVADGSSLEAVVPAAYLAGSGTHSVRGRVSDSSGAYTEYTTAITVRPKVVASAGGPYTVGEGQSVRLTGNASGLLQSSTAVYEWDLNYDGQRFDVDASGATPLFAAGSLGTGENRTVGLRVRDGDGTLSSISTVTISVVNAAPQADFAAPRFYWGQQAKVSFANVRDAATDVAAGFTYSYDWNNDGVFEVTGSTSSQLALPGQYLTDAGVHTVCGRITDQGGLSTDYSTTIAVRQPIVVSAGGPYSGAEGTSLTLQPTVSGLVSSWSAVYQWDLNYDGQYFDVDSTSPNAVIDGGSLVRGTTRTVALRVIDGDGSTSDIVTTTVTAVNAAPTAQLDGPVYVNVGSAATVVFTNVTDSAADMAAGFTYGFDFGGDGSWETINSTSPAATIPGDRLSTPGSYRVVAWVADQTGTRQNYETTIMVVNMDDYFPLAPGLTWTMRTYDSYEGEKTVNLSVGNGTFGGRNVMVLHTSESDGSETYDYLDGGAGKVVICKTDTQDSDSDGHINYATPLVYAAWGSGKVGESSGGTSRLSMSATTTDGPYTYSGSSTEQFTNVAIEPVTLSNGLYFSEALKVKETSSTVFGYTVQGVHATVTVKYTSYHWLVRGLGEVKYDHSAVTRLQFRGFDRSARSTESGELTEIPAWAHYATVSNGAVYLSGTSKADTFRFTSDGQTLTIYRNGLPDTVDLSSVSSIVVDGQGGDDLVTTGSSPVPVTIQGLGTYQGKSASITVTDSDGDKATVRLAGEGNGRIEWASGRGQVVLDGTKASSALDIAIKPSGRNHGPFAFGSISSTGPLQAITGKDVIVNGDITLDSAGSVADPGQAVSIALGGVDSGSINTGRTPLGTLTMRSWTNSEGGDHTLTAPSAGTISITGGAAGNGWLGYRGDLDASIRLTSGGISGSLTMAGAFTGDLTAQGDVNSVVASQIAGHLTANSFGSVSVKASRFAPNLAHDLRGSIRATGVNTKTQQSIGTLSIAGSLLGDAEDRGRVQTVGSVKTMAVGALLHSDVLVGVNRDFANALAGVHDFAAWNGTYPTLGSFSIVGTARGAQQPNYMEDAHLSAPLVGTVSLKNARVDGSCAVAVVRNQLKPAVIRYTDTRNAAYNWTWRPTNTTFSSQLIEFVDA